MVENQCATNHKVLLYHCEKGPWAVHLTLGLDFGVVLIFEVSVSLLDAKEHPGKLRLLAMHDRSFVLKHSIGLTRLSSVAVWH